MATVFNDILFGQTVLQQLTDSLTPLNAFSTDISSDVKSPGATVVVPLYGNLTATTYTQAASVMEGTGGTASAVTVSLSQRKIVSVDLTSGQLMESNAAANYSRWGTQLASGLATLVLQDIWSCIVTTSFGEPVVTTASASFGRSALIAARAALVKEATKGSKSCVINTGMEASLLGVDAFVLALNRGGNNTIENGTLGRLFGMDIYVSDVIPTNSISLTGFCCGSDGIAFASRSIGDFIPTGDYEAVETLTDPETGLSFLYTRHWSRAAAKYFINLQCLYGYSAAVTRALKPFVTATT